MNVLDARMRSGADGAEPRARSVSFVTFTLRLAEPGGITIPGGTGQAQAVLDRDAEDRVHLPATSLAGSLRDLVRQKRGDAVADDWFGRIVPGASGEDAARASRVWVLGSRRLDDADTQVLSSTRISRERGAADGSTLRAAEVLPAGSEFEAFLRWDDADPDAVADIAGLLAAWRPLLGRGVSRGRGRCEVTAVRHGTLRLDDAGDLLRWLTLSGPDLARAVAMHPVEVPAGGEQAGPLFRVAVQITGPWRIGTGQKPASGSRERTPLLRVPLDGPPTVPGSTIKGLARSRAEFIGRSVGLDPAPCGQGTCGQCWTCQVFGHGGGGDDEESPAVGRRAAIRFADATVAAPVCAERTHIAIDRFTGGVREGAFFTDEVLEGGTFTIEAELLPGAVGEARYAEIAAIMRLVLEDLNDGIIGMGSGTARGYGSVRVEFGEATALPDLASAQRTLAAMVRGGNDGIG